MWKKLGALLGVASITIAANDVTRWTDLPTTGFLIGRPATTDDVNGGNALFSMDGKSKGVLPIAIPQYAMWTDEHGAKHPMILEQAERAPNDLEIVGLRDFNGAETVATMHEVALLGTGKPH